ncbi:hypothetical protein AHAS_Ahas20G0220400 [Arachis hypogaea]
MAVSDGVVKKIILSYTYVAIWIFLSFTVIMYNKYILDHKMYNWPYPISLTMIHMAFCSSLAYIFIYVLKLVEPISMSRDLYLRSVVPISCDTVTLDISSGIDLHLHRRHLLQRRFPPVTSPLASSPCHPLCLLCQNRQCLPLRRSRSPTRDCVLQERNSFVNFQAKTGVENTELCLVLLDRWLFLIKLR